MSERLILSRSVSEREIEIARDFACGSTPADIARQYLKLPENVQKLVIVDVAAGLSSLVPSLLEEGANAYAIDPVYGVSLEEIDRLIEDTVDSTVYQAPPIYRWDMKYILDKSTGEFRNLYQAQKDRFIKGYATCLPFPDNFADYVISVNGIAGLLTEDPDFFISALREAVRVIKPDGKVIIFPWFAGNNWHPDACALHARVLKELLKDGNIKAEIETGYTIDSPIAVDEGSRLILTK